jgi:hydroxylamine reductase
VRHLTSFVVKSLCYVGTTAMYTLVQGCSTVGVCGKTPEVAHMQDALVHALKGLGTVANLARGVGIVDIEADRFTLRALFSTLTNVNFDEAYFVKTVPEALTHRDKLLVAYKAACTSKGVVSEVPPIACWAPQGLGHDAIEAAGVSVGVLERREAIGVEGAWYGRWGYLCLFE